MANALKLTRRQLAAFLPDEETIRKFEQLIALVEQINTTTIDELQSEVGIVSQKQTRLWTGFLMYLDLR